MSSRWCLVPLVLGLLALTPAAAARQLDATDRPRVTGPLIRDTRDCGRRATKSGGVVVGVAKSCVRFYRFRSGRESDPRRDYGVVWLQTNVNARPSWCATSVTSDILVPRRARLHAHKPKATPKSRERRLTTRLFVDAADHSGPNDAIIKRGYRLFGRTMRGVVRQERTIFRTIWYGSSARKLAFVSGIEISWPQAQGPPLSVNSHLNYKLKRKGTC
jgi:hypothetical protein